jgi:hypothetical protein
LSASGKYGLPFKRLVRACGMRVGDFPEHPLRKVRTGPVLTDRRRSRRLAQMEPCAQRIPHAA